MGISVARLRERRPEDFRVWPSWLLAAAAVLALQDRELARLPQPLRNAGHAFDYVSVNEEMRNTTGPILSENLSVLVLNRKPVLVEPFGLLQISQRGFWKTDRVVADCRRGYFALIVSEHRLRAIPGMDNCLDDRYALTRQLGPYDLYRPR